MNTHWSLPLATILFLITAPSSLPAADTVAQLAGDYLAKRPTTAVPPDITLPQAMVMQRQFVSRLQSQLGKPAGYKVGMVTREAQERFGLRAPLRGVLLSKMLLRNGAKVPADFGARPIAEADLLVVVKDKGIHRATTPLEVAQHLKEVVAFIELPDGILATNQPIRGPMVAAANVGARLGVVGQRAKVRPTQEFVDALAKMEVVMRDQDQELGRARGGDILGNPLNAVLWLIRELDASGERLRAGDVISLGSLKAVTPRAGQTLTVRYEGLPNGPISARVSFR